MLTPHVSKLLLHRIPRIIRRHTITTGTPNPLPTPNPPIHILRLLEYLPGMKDIQHNTSNNAHNPIQHHKTSLILHDRVPPPTGHLRNTVYASDEDRDVGDYDCDEGAAEFHVEDRGGRGGFAVLLTDFEGEEAEDEEGDDLERDADYHYAVGEFDAAEVGGHCCAAAGGEVLVVIRGKGRGGNSRLNCDA